MLVDLIKKTIPEYSTTLPTIKRSITFRPILVKEEKNIAEILTLTKTTKDKILSLCEIINSCCDYKIDSKTISIMDFQHLMLEIRKKSISETTKIKMKCPHTNEDINLTLNLDEVVSYNKDKKSILSLELNDNLKIKIETPKIKTLLKLNDLNLEENFIFILAESIIEIENEKEKIDLNLYSMEEKIKFTELIDRKNYKEIKKFMFSSLYTFKLNYTTGDGIEREVIINDLVNFFKFYLAMLI